jgi:MSHA pilin protein MshD
MIQILFEKVEMRIKKLFLVSGSAFRVASPKRSESLCEATTVFLLRGQRGISLIELIMFIMIVSVALAGILLVMNVTTKSSADPLVHKQALAIAESLLEEIELMPFTYCDPNDVNAASAVSALSCSAGMDQNKGGAVLTTPTPATENRWSATDPFDNVADYGGFVMNSGICDITNTTSTCTAPIAGLGAYQAAVNVSRAGLALGLASDDLALRITVTVTGLDGLPVVMEGIRTRYSPRGVP